MENKEIKSILASALSRAEDGLGMEGRRGSPHYTFSTELNCIVNPDSELIPLEDELEEILVWCLVSLAKTRQAREINQAVQDFYATKQSCSEPLRAEWWKYGELGSPETLRQYIPKREHAEQKAKKVLKKMRS